MNSSRRALLRHRRSIDLRCVDAHSNCSVSAGVAFQAHPDHRALSCRWKCRFGQPAPFPRSFRPASSSRSSSTTARGPRPSSGRKWLPAPRPTVTPWGSSPDSHAINQALGKLPKGSEILGAKISYDATRDFIPISGVALVPLVLVVHPPVPARSVKELVDLSNARKDKGVNFGIHGTGQPLVLAHAPASQADRCDPGRRVLQGTGTRSHGSPRRPDRHHADAGALCPAVHQERQAGSRWLRWAPNAIRFCRRSPRWPRPASRDWK